MFALFPRATSRRLFVCLFLLTGPLVAGTGVPSTSVQQSGSAKTNPSVLIDTTKSVAFSKQKSPGRALTYSIAGTLLPVFVGVKEPYVLGFGLIFGPSTGHFYAENTRQALVGIGIRTGAPLITFGLFGYKGSYDGLFAKAFIAGSIVVARTVYDMATADNSAREYNEQYASNVRVAPTVGLQGEQVGLALRVSF